MRELKEFRDGFEDAVAGRPLTVAEVRRRARHRTVRRWVTGAGALAAGVLVGVQVVDVGGGGGDGVVDHGVLVASGDDMGVLHGDAGSQAGGASSGDITTLLSSVDAIVEIERIELVEVVDELSGLAGERRTLVFSTQLAPVGAAPPPGLGDTTRILEVLWDGRPSLVSLIEPGTRVLALLDEITPAAAGNPDGTTHSLSALLTLDDEGGVSFLALEAGPLDAALEEARLASAFEGVELDLLVAWIDELTEDPVHGGPITLAYRTAIAPDEPAWAAIPPEERIVEPGVTPEEVLAAMERFQVLVEVEPAVASASDDHVLSITSEIGVHHVAALHNSIGDVWIGTDSTLFASVRRSERPALLAELRLPRAPDAEEGWPPTLLVTVAATDGGLSIDAEWIDAVTASGVLERWADRTLSAPSHWTS